MLLDAPTLAAVAVLAVGAAIVSGMSGFGTGVILTAALVPLIGVKAVIPVLAVAGVIINAGRFWFYRGHLDRRTFGERGLDAEQLGRLGRQHGVALDAEIERQCGGHRGGDHQRRKR